MKAKTGQVYKFGNHEILVIDTSTRHIDYRILNANDGSERRIHTMSQKIWKQSKDKLPMESRKDNR